MELGENLGLQKMQKAQGIPEKAARASRGSATGVSYAGPTRWRQRVLSGLLKRGCVCMLGQVFWTLGCGDRRATEHRDWPEDQKPEHGHCWRLWGGTKRHMI